MRRKSINHGKHEGIAVIAFIITLFLAFGAFYYAWQVNIQYGKSVAGTQSLAEIMWQKQQAEQESQLQDISARNGCCIEILNPSIGSRRNIDVKTGSGGGCLDHMDGYTQGRVARGDLIVTNIEPRPCPGM
jgi:hypothetical protein